MKFPNEDPRPLFTLTELTPNISHYYGDMTRQLFVAAAVIAAIAIPLFGEILPFGIVIQTLSIILLVFLAALTNPRSRMIHWYNTIVSGIGVLLLEVTAVSLYSTDSMALFIARELVAVLLIFGFYLSTKTLRAIEMRQIGKEPQDEAKELVEEENKR